MLSDKKYSEAYITKLCENTVVVDFMLTNHTHLNSKQICDALGLTKTALEQVADRLKLSIIDTHEETELSCIGDAIGAVTPNTIIHPWSGGITVRTPINDKGIISVTRHLSGIRNKKSTSSAFDLPKQSVMFSKRKPKVLSKKDDISPKKYHHYNKPIESSEECYKTNIKLDKLKKASI